MPRSARLAERSALRNARDALEWVAAVDVDLGPAGAELRERGVGAAAQLHVGEQPVVAVEGVLGRVGAQPHTATGGGEPFHVGGGLAAAALDAAVDLGRVDADQPHGVVRAARRLERADADRVAVDDGRDARLDRLGPVRCGRGRGDESPPPPPPPPLGSVSQAWPSSSPSRRWGSPGVR